MKIKSQQNHEHLRRQQVLKNFDAQNFYLLPCPVLKIKINFLNESVRVPSYLDREPSDSL